MRVLYTRQPTAPSIPAAGQCHGYEEGEDGKLLPQEQPQHDPTMGPAYYNTSHVGGEGVVGVEEREGRKEGRGMAKGFQEVEMMRKGGKGRLVN